MLLQNGCVLIHNMKTVPTFHKDKHEFALHVPFLSSLAKRSVPGDEIVIIDERLVHRMSGVLRLTPKKQCVFFDKQVHVYGEIQEFSRKKQVSCTVIRKETNTIFSPSLIFLLPILKREDFELALYSLTEIGVNTIQLIMTKKTHKAAFNQKDFERSQRIIIAAAEQSKNFAYPELKYPVMLSDSVNEHLPKTRLFFDQKGIALFPVIENLQRDRPRDIVLLIGPEGDLSSEEKEMVLSKEFITCSLTSTVLRSVQAAAISAGLIRSLVAI